MLQMSKYMVTLCLSVFSSSVIIVIIIYHMIIRKLNTITQKMLLKDENLWNSHCRLTKTGLFFFT